MMREKGRVLFVVRVNYGVTLSSGWRIRLTLAVKLHQHEGDVISLQSHVLVRRRENDPHRGVGLSFVIRIGAFHAVQTDAEHVVLGCRLREEYSERVAFFSDGAAIDRLIMTLIY